MAQGEGRGVGIRAARVGVSVAGIGLAQRRHLCVHFQADDHLVFSDDFRVLGDHKFFSMCSNKAIILGEVSEATFTTSWCVVSTIFPSTPKSVMTLMPKHRMPM